MTLLRHLLLNLKWTVKNFSLIFTSLRFTVHWTLHTEDVRLSAFDKVVKRQLKEWDHGSVWTTDFNAEISFRKIWTLSKQPLSFMIPYLKNLRSVSVAKTATAISKNKNLTYELYAIFGSGQSGVVVEPTESENSSVIEAQFSKNEKKSKQA